MRGGSEGGRGGIPCTYVFFRHKSSECLHPLVPIQSAEPQTNSSRPSKERKALEEG